MWSQERGAESWSIWCIRQLCDCDVVQEKGQRAGALFVACQIHVSGPWDSKLWVYWSMRSERLVTTAKECCMIKLPSHDRSNLQTLYWHYGIWNTENCVLTEKGPANYYSTLNIIIQLTCDKNAVTGWHWKQRKKNHIFYRHYFFLSQPLPATLISLGYFLDCLLISGWLEANI